MAVGPLSHTSLAVWTLSLIESAASRYRTKVSAALSVRTSRRRVGSKMKVKLDYPTTRVPISEATAK